MQVNLAWIQCRDAAAWGEFLSSVCSVHHCGWHYLRVADEVALYVRITVKAVGV